MEQNDKYGNDLNEYNRKLITSAKIMSDMDDTELEIFCKDNSKEDQIIIIDKAMDILISLEEYEGCEKLVKIKEKIYDGKINK